MAVSGRIRRRLALAIVLTALIPVLGAVFLAERMVRQTAARFYLPEIGAHLDRSLSLYQELARTVKSLMRQEAAAIAEREPLRRAAQDEDRAAMQSELTRAFQDHPRLVRLGIQDASGKELASQDRGRPVDAARENQLQVIRPLAEDPSEEGPVLVAIFAIDKQRFEELSEMSQFVDTYREIERRRESDEQSYVLAFALLLGLTIILAVGVGALLARSVVGRIGELARATGLVAAGDLGVRVPERGEDEIGDLARAFNRMLREVADSRARVEYLRRIAAWQEMARWLAHEIKNPLTPIRLAVQEAHQRYQGSDPAYQKLLDSTLEIIEDEVGTLRRLVGEFSDFARLPQAKLEREDLASLLRDLRQQLNLSDDEGSEADLPAELLREWKSAPIELSFEIPPGRAEVWLDRQMLRRVLINLIQNAAQAMRGMEGAVPRISVKLARDDEFYDVDVDDSGPGIPEGMQETVFDPYVTTRADGTGLGLSIVKKIVVEHGGVVEVGKSPLGGARLRVRLPAHGTQAATLAHRAIVGLIEASDHGEERSA